MIRRTLLLNGHPIGAFTTPIQSQPDSIDEQYGECYVIHNHQINDGTEHAIPGVCMKKSKFGLYYNITIGI